MKHMSKKRIGLLITLLMAAIDAHAQSAGSFYTTAGWIHISPQNDSQPLQILSVGGRPINQTEFGTGSSVGQSDTLGLTLGYFVTDHIAAELVGGIPPRVDLSGEGSLQSFGVLGHGYQESPAVVLKYYFNEATAKFRPYVGIGGTYMWFSGVKLTNQAFESGVLGGPTHVDTQNEWQPIFNAGFTYRFDRHWFAGISASYTPVSLTANLTTQRVTPIGPLTQVSQAKIKIDPIITYLNIGYSF